MTAFSDRELRDALGQYATGVTVVTTSTDRGPLGMTANSFASVSLDPPLVLWSPARHSKRFPAFEAAEYFAIHVLSDDQEALAIRFAQSGEDFDGVSHTAGLGGAPVIAGCTAVLECRHAAGHDGGDHLILVGEVEQLTHTQAEPLIYHRGRFTRLA